MSDLLQDLLDRCLTERDVDDALASEQGQALAELVAAAEEHKPRRDVEHLGCRLCIAIEALREAVDAP